MYCVIPRLGHCWENPRSAKASTVNVLMREGSRRRRDMVKQAWEAYPGCGSSK
jgi:hypothetical protein